MSSDNAPCKRKLCMLMMYNCWGDDGREVDVSRSSFYILSIVAPSSPRSLHRAAQIFPFILSHSTTSPLVSSIPQPLPSHASLTAASSITPLHGKLEYDSQRPRKAHHPYLAPLCIWLPHYVVYGSRRGRFLRTERSDRQFDAGCRYKHV